MVRIESDVTRCTTLVMRGLDRQVTREMVARMLSFGCNIRRHPAFLEQHGNPSWVGDEPFERCEDHRMDRIHGGSPKSSSDRWHGMSV